MFAQVSKHRRQQVVFGKLGSRRTGLWNRWCFRNQVLVAAA